jgi:hypothetical protein
LRLGLGVGADDARQGVAVGDAERRKEKQVATASSA